MSVRNWPFIHEWTILEYLDHRYNKRTLRLKCIIKNGKNQTGKNPFVKVLKMDSPRNTDFPDIKGIKLSGSKRMRPAEVKFTTLLFNYHNDKKHKRAFKGFLKKHGFILVLNHDVEPKRWLSTYRKKIDVYQIDTTDFISFARENFDRLLNRQIKKHDQQKAWIMYQGPDNFPYIKQQKKKIWCSTQKLSNIDLGEGDRIVFIKFEGAGKQGISKDYAKEIVSKKLILSNIYIAEATSLVRSRQQYCNTHKLDYFKDKLWKYDKKKKNGQWSFDNVFEFKKIVDITKKIKLVDHLYKHRLPNRIGLALVGAFLNWSQNISIDDYSQLIESLL